MRSATGCSGPGADIPALCSKAVTRPDSFSESCLLAYSYNSANIVVQTGVSPATNSYPTDLHLYL